MSYCASCGVAMGDDLQCTVCHAVRNCSVESQKQKNHLTSHKRAAELHDEILFKQPEGSCHGDCPICFLPLPIDQSKSTVMSCCSTVVCDGCCVANQKREDEEKRPRKCPFCRTPPADSKTEIEERLKDRAEMGDPVAMYQLGTLHYNDGDDQCAFQYWSKAAELGDVGAHYLVAFAYGYGYGVEKDESKEVYHLEQAAIGGHPYARHNLGNIEWYKARYERAVKHWIISTKLGADKSLDYVKELYKHGRVSADDFAAALLGHQAAVNAMKSPHRDDAEAEAARS